MARRRVASLARRLTDRRLAQACAAAAAASLAAGCGTSTSTSTSTTSKTVDASTVRPVIDKQIDASGAPSAQSVSCPTVSAANGKTLTCHVTLQDGSAYDIVITDGFTLQALGPTGPTFLIKTLSTS